MEALISIEEALARILLNCQYRKTEVSDLYNAFEKTLAEDVEAVYDVPAFDRAMLDGYAVNYEDIRSASWCVWQNKSAGCGSGKLQFPVATDHVEFMCL